jgi:hypothetical protein
LHLRRATVVRGALVLKHRRAPLILERFPSKFMLEAH